MQNTHHFTMNPVGGKKNQSVPKYSHDYSPRNEVRKSKSPVIPRKSYKKMQNQHSYMLVNLEFLNWRWLGYYKYTMLLTINIFKF